MSEQSKKKKKKKSILPKHFPFDCFSHILLFLDKSKDFVNLLLSIKGLNEYVRTINKSSTKNIPFRLHRIPDKPQPHVNYLVVSNKKPGKKGYHNMSYYLAGSFESEDYETLMEKISHSFPSLYKLKIIQGTSSAGDRLLQSDRGLNLASFKLDSVTPQLGWLRELEIVLTDCSITLNQPYHSLRKLTLVQNGEEHKDLHVNWSKLRSVRELFLEGWEVRSNFKDYSVDTLTLRDTLIEKERIQELRSTLHSLTIEDSIEGLDCLEDLPVLNSLSIDLESCETEGPLPFQVRNLPNLVYFHLKGFESWNHPGTFELKDFPRLSKVILKQVGFECFLSREVLRNLEVLELEDSRIRFSLSDDCRMEKLWKLVLKGTIVNGNIMALLSSKKFRRIHFNPRFEDVNNNDIPKTDIILKDLRRLTWLSFSNSDRYELVGVYNSPMIKRLTIENFTARLESDEFSRLVSLIIYKMKGGKQAIRNLMLRKWESLRRLFIQYDDEDENNNRAPYRSFIFRVDNFPKLRWLDMVNFNGSCSFDGKKKSKLMEFQSANGGSLILQNHPKLEFVSHNGIFSFGCKLEDCPLLKRVSLFANLFQEIDEHFNLHLKNLTSLTDLSLSGWGIIDDFNITNSPNINKLTLIPRDSRVDVLSEDHIIQEDRLYTFPVTNEFFPNLKRLTFDSLGRREENDEGVASSYKIKMISNDKRTLKKIYIKGNRILHNGYKKFVKTLDKKLKSGRIKVYTKDAGDGKKRKSETLDLFLL